MARKRKPAAPKPENHPFYDAIVGVRASRLVLVRTHNRFENLLPDHAEQLHRIKEAVDDLEIDMVNHWNVLTTTKAKK